MADDGKGWQTLIQIATELALANPTDQLIKDCWYLLTSLADSFARDSLKALDSSVADDSSAYLMLLIVCTRLDTMQATRELLGGKILPACLVIVQRTQDARLLLMLRNLAESLP